MELEILKDEEKRMNLIMFLFVAVIPVCVIYICYASLTVVLLKEILLHLLYQQEAF